MGIPLAKLQSGGPCPADQHWWSVKESSLASPSSNSIRSIPSGTIDLFVSRWWLLTPLDYGASFCSPSLFSSSGAGYLKNTFLKTEVKRALSTSAFPPAFVIQTVENKKCSWQGIWKLKREEHIFKQLCQTISGSQTITIWLYNKAHRWISVFIRAISLLPWHATWSWDSHNLIGQILLNYSPLKASNPSKLFFSFFATNKHKKDQKVLVLAEKCTIPFFWLKRKGKNYQRMNQLSIQVCNHSRKHSSVLAPGSQSNPHNTFLSLKDLHWGILFMWSSDAKPRSKYKTPVESLTEKG